MSFRVIKEFPSPSEIIQEIPLSKELQEIKKKRDQEIRDVIELKNDRFLVIVGPCSAHDEKAVLDYVRRLSKLEEEVRDRVLIIPRVYTNKPRTTGEGYKGMLHQPNPKGDPDLLGGLKAIRKMHIHVMEESGLTSADEMLYPENLPYLDDLLSYIAVGARSVENQQHRLVASGIDIPVGMKNPTSGDFNVMFNSVQAAQNPHTFLYRNEEVATTSNPLTHAILRGSCNKHGNDIPNYHFEDILLAIAKYEQRNLKNPMIVIDTNHNNSGKDYTQQSRIVREVINNRKIDSSIHNYVRGFMIESFLVEGKQDVEEGVYGKSITDACVGWDETENLIRYIAENV